MLPDIFLVAFPTLKYTPCLWKKEKMSAFLPQESLPNARTESLCQAAFRKEFPQSELEFNTGYVMPSEG